MIEINGKIYTDVWYEVFISDDEFGSYTVDSCNTLEEAIDLRNELIKEYGSKVWIDKWGSILESQGYESEQIEHCVL